MGIVGTAADQIFGHVKLDAPLGPEPADDLFHLGHDFRADAVAGEDKKGRICHGNAPVLADGTGLAKDGPGVKGWRVGSRGFSRVKFRLIYCY
ncbi:hypothetical protein GCM10007315_06680 [Gemmobacter tilapiae]|uniref:Uncharacterized protein n=1 Tax=Neogemmobacter tilapiae TaxID=875041 RepID=A0A918WFV4_9RHOB|nr:hypothetical protein GCM10007315_06680 [Gemmobacter tilapiae]